MGTLSSLLHVLEVLHLLLVVDIRQLKPPNVSHDLTTGPGEDFPPFRTLVFPGLEQEGSGFEVRELGKGDSRAEPAVQQDLESQHVNYVEGRMHGRVVILGNAHLDLLFRLEGSPFESV